MPKLHDIYLQPFKRSKIKLKKTNSRPDWSQNLVKTLMDTPVEGKAHPSSTFECILDKSRTWKLGSLNRCDKDHKITSVTKIWFAILQNFHSPDINGFCQLIVYVPHTATKSKMLDINGVDTVTVAFVFDALQTFAPAQTSVTFDDLQKQLNQIEDCDIILSGSGLLVLASKQAFPKALGLIEIYHNVTFKKVRVNRIGENDNSSRIFYQCKFSGDSINFIEKITTLYCIF